MIPLRPSDLFGPIFIAVQERHLFEDSKSFADAVPLRPIDAILADWHAATPADDDALRLFVRRNFRLPIDESAGLRGTGPLADHIAAVWPLLTREQRDAAPQSSEIALPRPFIVPGGRFRELYYWDSYFTLLALLDAGEQIRVEDAIVNFGSLLDRFGHIPNGTRSYYLGRSHPPVFYLVAQLSNDASDGSRQQRLDWMRAEHRFWMAGADTIVPGGEHRRVVRLPDGALLNRYWDDQAGPRDESWREDVALAASVPDRDAQTLWRDLRAAAESGWDFSSRWLADGGNLSTIRTTRLLPIDLNCLLHGLEHAIAIEAADLGDASLAADFHGRADARAEAINTHLWNAPGGFFADYDIDRRRAMDQLTAAAAFPLFTAVCNADRVVSSIHSLGQLMRRGGLMTTLIETGQQWDAPNGWAPLQWVVVLGLQRYGYAGLAKTIADRWSMMVDDHYRSAGTLVEKYDVEERRAGSGGEYTTETGFGWTNGVTSAFRHGNFDDFEKVLKRDA